MCLGGHSKTLMFVSVSPDPSSNRETSSSLQFAERVNACEIGIRRRQDVGGSVQHGISAHKDRQGYAAYHRQKNQPTPSYQQTPKPIQKLKQTQYYQQTPRPSINTRYKQQQPTTFIPAQIPSVSAAGLTSQSASGYKEC